MIKKAKYKEEIFEYQVFGYLYSRLFNFAIEHCLDIWTENTLEIGEKHIDLLIEICVTCMLELLDKHYEEPSQKQRSKNPSRYKKILIAKQKFAIDYRTNPMGREVVGINYFLEWLRKVKKYKP